MYQLAWHNVPETVSLRHCCENSYRAGNNLLKQTRNNCCCCQHCSGCASWGALMWKWGHYAVHCKKMYCTLHQIMNYISIFMSFYTFQFISSQFMYLTMPYHLNWHTHLRLEVQRDNFCCPWTGSLLLWTKSSVSHSHSLSLSLSLSLTHTHTHVVSPYTSQTCSYNINAAIHTRTVYVPLLKISIENHVCLQACSKENIQITGYESEMCFIFCWPSFIFDLN